MKNLITPLLFGILLLNGCSQIQQPNNSQPAPTNSEQAAQQPQPYTVEKTSTADLKPPFDPLATDNLWLRIKGQLSFSDSDDKRVKQRIDWYLKHPNYMDTISERAAPLLYYLVEEVEKREMPIELALMPLIESDFDTQAYSHKHASGLWQLTPLIAKHFGAKINAWYDGRQDIVDSTRVALDFLQYLHQRFDGNWYHAIAAYNTGEGRVLAAIERNKKAGKPTDFFHLKLPRQTSHYVPKLLAAAQLLKHDLMAFPKIPNRSTMRVIKLDQQAILSDLKGWKDVETLNPGYARFPALLGGPAHIVVPTARVAEWQAMLADLPKMPADTWQHYTIRRGDSLSTIAQRYSLSVAELKAFNQLKSDRIRAGKKLILPILADKQLDYKIKHGDSLWRIAKQFNVSVAKLKQWNQLSTDRLKIGDTLLVFLSP
ncbi:LysM peptidoglycan-binding domain-containing protein [Pseudoalteromonas piscicida]|uniref:Lytic transglycosylase n=1 Tax=Pseudoalteromonas piscicida TaxID=43662 RepID=A0A2A5JLJ3_PSEO7|nr:LysM peptidoglycan-binding domain-containing protein [Pseudoalteromonas piscicida]PCK30300.1 lytic transglycosylase [Pseudoalteromonas piscicida]